MVTGRPRRDLAFFSGRRQAMRKCGEIAAGYQDDLTVFYHQMMNLVVSQTLWGG
jgi:hypothetical protein